VLVNGDTLFEPDETFQVQVSLPIGATATLDPAATTATGTIKNDDVSPKPTVTVAPIGTAQLESVGTYKFNVTLSKAPDVGQPVTVQYRTVDNSAIGGQDFTAATGTLTFNSTDASLTQVVSVAITDDTIYEPTAETFSLELVSATNADLATVKTASGSITDNDPKPTISLTPLTASQPEAQAATTPYSFTVNLSNPSSEVITVGYQTVQDTTTNGATSGSDYVAVTAGTLTFAPGDTSKTFTVRAIDDTLIESNETFSVQLSAPPNAQLGTNSKATVTIANDDAPPVQALTLSTVPTPITEGKTGDRTKVLLTVSVPLPATAPISFNYGTLDGSAAIGRDFNSPSGLGQIPIGQTSASFEVEVLGNDIYEGDKTFQFFLSNVQGATPATAQPQSTITIQEDEPLPLSVVSVSLDTPEQLEGKLGDPDKIYSFTINLQTVLSAPLTVGYTTVDGVGATGATAGSDYIANTGSVTFTPGGANTQTVQVKVKGDNLAESKETFALKLVSSPTTFLSPVGQDSAVATILDDDTLPVVLPTVSIVSTTPSQAEGNLGDPDKTYSFTVNLQGAITAPVTVNYGTVDGFGATGAAAGSDYTAKTSSLTFTPGGPTSQVIQVNVKGDNVTESDETFSVQLQPNAAVTLGSATATATIVNDDAVVVPPTLPTVAIAPLVTSQSEATPGYSFKVTLSKPATQVTTVNYSTVNGTALAGSDYGSQTGTLSFGVGESEKTITIAITDDALVEATETFSVVLSAPSNATLLTSSAVGTIADNDVTPLPVPVPVPVPLPQIERNISLDGSSDILWRNYQSGETALWQLNRTPTVTSADIITIGDASNWRSEASADFNNDGYLDLLWRNYRTGENAVWLMQSGALLSALYLQTVSDVAWQIQGTADFTADGQADILWRHQRTGELAIWQMNGTQLVKGINLSTVADVNWQVLAVSDFSNDRSPDLLWQNRVTGETGIWVMNGTQFVRADLLPTVQDRDWRFAGIGDFNADRQSDLAWHNQRTGQTAIWEMNGTQLLRGSFVDINTDTIWETQAVADFNGDGGADILWRNPQTNETAVWYMKGTKLGVGQYLPTQEAGSKILQVGDFNRDGQPDIIWLNNRSAVTSIWKTNASLLNAGIQILTVPDATWTPETTADFNRDGGADILWRNQRTGEVALWEMNGSRLKAGTFLPTVADLAWQVIGTADFDRDGNIDILWQNRRSGESAIWYMNGLNLLRGEYLLKVDPTWQLQLAADFNQDQSPDLLWRNTQTGENAIWLLDRGRLVQGISLIKVVDQAWTVVLAKDFDADRRTDILWQNQRTGEVALWHMNGATLGYGTYIEQSLGLSGVIKGASDFNQDGSLDLLWSNQATGALGVWYLNKGNFGAVAYLPTVGNLNWQIEGLDNFKS
jgi:Calx-beta domain/FG-GAP-like repeat